MKKFLFSSLTLATFTAMGATPTDIAVTAAPGVPVQIIRHSTDKLLNVTITVPKSTVVIITRRSTWDKIADENQTFNINALDGAGYPVRYGVDPNWVSKVLPAGPYKCDNATFTDPLVGTVKHCEKFSQLQFIPVPQPPNVPPVPPMMHAGVQGIDKVNVIVASFDGMGFQPGTDALMLSDPTPLGDPATESNWEQDGAVRTVCKASHVSNDDAIVYPGQPGKAHDHTFFAPGADAFLSDANVRNPGSKSTCRGGTLDLTRRWVPSMYDTVTMRTVVPHILLMYYKTGNCVYSIDCSGRSDFTTAVPMVNLHWPPKGLHLIAGDPTATSDAGVTRFSCMVNATGNAMVGAADQATIPKCLDDGSQSLWMGVHMPNCLAVNPDGTPVVDSPDHKSHAAYTEGWPNYNSPTPGKAYRCPLDHPYEIAQIDFKVIFDIMPGMDTSKWNLSCGSVYCGHADWFDGWDQTIMVPTNEKCLQDRRNCGSFQIFDGRTAQEFQGN